MILLRSQTWGDLMKPKSKLAISLTYQRLRPATFHSRIENDFDVGKKELSKQWLPFFNYVVDMVVQCEESVPAKTIHQPTAKGAQVTGP